MGALMLDQGPKVGDASPVFGLDSLGGGSVAVGLSAVQKSQLLFFLSPTCPVRSSSRNSATSSCWPGGPGPSPGVTGTAWCWVF